MPGGDAAARADILKGMIAVEKAAYGQTFPEGEPKDLKDLKLHAPWFRFPGFADTQDLRDWFAANNVGIFGVDLWASDWIKMTPAEELKLVMGCHRMAEFWHCEKSNSAFASPIDSPPA